MIPRSLSTIIREAVRSEMLNLHTSMPGTIISFDPDDQTVEVQLDLKFRRSVSGGYVEEEVDVLKDVPIIYPRANNYSLTMPIVPGDTCEVRFMERSIDNWLLEGGTVSPEDYRHHSLSDAVCYVGMWDRTKSIYNYNAAQPELRTGDAQRKVWLDDNRDKNGFVEMVDLDNDSRTVLKSNGEVRVANDKVRTVMEIYPDTKIQMQNPLSLTRMDPYGDILQRNPLITRQMDRFGDITDKTILAKSLIQRSGRKFFKNLIAKQITHASGKIDYRSMLNKLEINPNGKSRLGNSINKLTVDLVKAKLGNPLSNLNITPIQSTLGNPLSKLRVLPTSAMLQDVGGVVTPALVTGLVSAVTGIIGNLGLDALLGPITSELANIQNLLNALPEDEAEEPDLFDSVSVQVADTLIENNIDIESQEAINVLRLAEQLDQNWNEQVFEEMVSQMEVILDNG